MAGRINGLHHVALSVPDLDQARDFYVGLLGFEEGPSGSWEPGTAMNDRIMRLTGSSGRAMFVKAGNVFLEFFEFASPAPAPLVRDRPVCNYGYTHMALDVTDLAAIHARLSAAGMDFHTDPLSGYGVTTTYGRDPFGNVIELQEIHDEGYVKRVAL
ncbi:MAG TPA: VOC family protein [Alphaproteobacteria bacterium]|jgi:catechol 2,3-dioxygenase-like lactoylglutathione lyase family enzyme|nr:VOC family protein [Alphaproteobacteria bacterium]